MIRGRFLTCVPLIVLAALVAACSGAAGPPVATPAASSADATGSPAAAPSAAGPSAAASAGAPTSSPAGSPTASKKAAKPLPSIDPATVDAFLTAKITLLNLGDADLAVTVTYLDPSGGKPESLGAYTVSSFEQQSYDLPPGGFRIDFAASGASPAAKCTMTVKDGQAWSFVAVPGAIAVNRLGYKPATGRDLFVATSSLCAK